MGFSFLGSLAVACTSTYFGYQDAAGELKEGLEDKLWQLEKEDVEDCNELQKKLLHAPWRLLHQYGLPDEYRLVQSDLNGFYKALQERDATRRFRMLQSLEAKFRVYPLYWFYRGRAALDAGNAAAGRQCFEEFDKVWRPVLRQDPYRLEVAKHRVLALLEKDNQEPTGETRDEILKQLETIRKHTSHEDWGNNLFAGFAYFKVGEQDRGRACVELNIDFGYEKEISGPALRSMEQGDLDDEKFVLELPIGALPENWIRGTDTRKMIYDLSEKGNRFAQLERGKQHYKSKEYGKALEWMTKAAEQGLPAAQKRLGDLYVEGKGVGINIPEALEWYRKAAKQGLPEAQKRLGDLYFEGKGVGINIPEALEWYLKAAEQGLPEAQKRLGDLYFEGKGVGKNIPEALKWYLKAAEQGDTEARKMYETQKKENP